MGGGSEGPPLSGRVPGMLFLTVRCLCQTLAHGCDSVHVPQSPLTGLPRDPAGRFSPSCQGRGSRASGELGSG